MNPSLSLYFLSSNFVVSLSSLCSPTSLLSLMPPSHAILAPVVSSPSTHLSSPYPPAKPAALFPCASDWCVLLLTHRPCVALRFLLRRNRCCVLGGVTLGLRINVMFRTKHIVHHAVPLPRCSHRLSLLSVASPRG